MRKDVNRQHGNDKNDAREIPENGQPGNATNLMKYPSEQMKASFQIGGNREGRLAQKRISETGAARPYHGIGIGHVHPIVNVYRKRIALMGYKGNVIGQCYHWYHEISRHRHGT